MAKTGFRSKTFDQVYVFKKCDTVIFLYLSTSVLPCQYYAAHALYSFSSNVGRIRRTNGQIFTDIERSIMSDVIMVIGIGYNSAISTSKIMEMAAIKKNRDENCSRAEFFHQIHIQNAIFLLGLH